MDTDIRSEKLFVKAAEVALSPSASKDCMQLSPAQPKRQLEVQLSEVSDETCDRAAVSFLASLEQHGLKAGSPHAKKPKTSLACCQPAADDASRAGSTPSTPANPSTGAHAGAAALQNHISLQQHLIGRISTPMGPPAAVGTGQLSLGSLLVAAQMAYGGAASNSNGRVGGDSPLLLATQATLQATTASVVAAEVLAAVSRPGGISRFSTACAGTGVSPAALAGILAKSVSPGQAHAAVSATGPMQQQQAVLAPLHRRAASAPPAAAPCAQEDQDMHGAPMREQHVAPADSDALRTSAQQEAQDAGQMSLAALAAASAGAAAPAQEQQQASMDTDMLQDIPADTPQAPAPSSEPAGTAATAADVASTPAAAPAKPQLPSWLCETSPELKASQAICKASLHTATAALARLSSPRGLSLSAAVAAHKSAAAHAPSGALPPAAFAGQAHWARHGAVGAGGTTHTPAVFAGAHGSSWAAAAAAAAPALRGPSLAPSALSPVAHLAPTVAAPAPGPAVVFGIPARDVAAGVHTVWGLPVCASAAAVAASNTAVLLSAQQQAAAAAAAATAVDGVVHLRVRKAHSPAAPAVSAESEMADAGSCSSTPKAAVAAAAAAAGATGRLAAAALKLSVHSQQVSQQQQQRQQQGCFFGVPNCCDSAALTADDASSPMCCADNDVTSGLTAGGEAAAELDAAANAAAAVVVHVEIKRGKAGTGAAAPAKQHEQEHQQLVTC